MDFAGLEGISDKYRNKAMPWERVSKMHLGV
jgi:hypothetical protein